MIGLFAKMFGNRERVVEIAPADESGSAYEVRSQEDGAPARTTRADEATPEGFVERVPSEGGDVLYVPFLEMLRRAVRRKP